MKYVKAKVKFFQSKRNKNYYFKVIAKNGEIVAQSEGYKTRAMRIKGLKSLMAALGSPITQIEEIDSNQAANNKLINQL